MISENKLKWIKELCVEAEKSWRIFEWEAEFVDSIQHRLLQYGPRLTVSEKQWEVLKTTEQKLFSL